jgi:hypothetical protein
MIADRNRIYDGWVQLEAGVDAGRGPTLIDPNQFVSAENMVFRGGFPTVRPGFRKLTETFTNDNHGFDSRGVEIPFGQPVPPNLTASYNYRNGNFQCFIAYSPHHGDDCLMALVGGRLYKIVPMLNTSTVTEITVSDARSPYDTARTGTDGSIDMAHPNQFNSQSANFQPSDVGALLLCAGHYSGGGTTISQIVTPPVGPSTQVITKDNATVGGSNLTWLVGRQAVPYQNFQASPIAYMVQADKFLVAQDGIAKAIIYDSKDARRASLEGTPETLEVPTGTMMAFGMGRLVVVVNERDVAFGDLYGSHLDTQTDPSDSIILFTERNFLAGGFDAAIPFQQGIATGIQFFPQLDTSTGNGQLLVFAERGAASFNMALDRLLWQTSQFQIIALLTTGMRGHRSISIVNEDLWFRGDDGFRTFRQARSDAWGWAHIPLSTNVDQFLTNDDGKLLKYASSIYFDNRLIGTCSPTWNNGRVYHNGMVVVDFDILSSFGTKYKPTWDGHWTMGTEFTSGLPDIKLCQLTTGTFDGVTRAFAFGMEMQKDSEGNITYQNGLYELSFDDKDDFGGSIPFDFVSRAFDFKGGGQQSNQFTENELYDGDLWVTDISQGGVPAGT